MAKQKYDVVVVGSGHDNYFESHDVKNLFVTDGSCFVSLPGTHGITTWIMALSWLASEYLAAGMKKGEI